MRKRSRLTLLREARALDEAGGFWHVQHVAAVLGVAPRTVYDLPGLSAKKLRGRGQERQIRRYDPAEVKKWARRKAS